MVVTTCRAWRRIRSNINPAARQISPESYASRARTTNNNRIRSAPLLAAAGLVELTTPDEVATKKQAYYIWLDRSNVTHEVRHRRQIRRYMIALREFGVPSIIIRNHVRYWRRGHHSLVYLADMLHTLAWAAGGFRFAKELTRSLHGAHAWVDDLHEQNQCKLYPGDRAFIGSPLALERKP